MNKKNNISKIFLWSPMLSNVGTNGAMIGMAKSLKKYSNAEIYLINVLGEFTKYKSDKFYSIDFFKINNLIPNTGKISKYLIQNCLRLFRNCEYQTQQVLGKVLCYFLQNLSCY